MIVGLVEVELLIREALTLKDKRMVVKSLVERIRVKFHVSVAQVGFLDNRQRATLGIALVGNEVGYVNQVLDKIEGFIVEHTGAEILAIRRDVI